MTKLTLYPQDIEALKRGEYVNLDRVDGLGLYCIALSDYHEDGHHWDNVDIWIDFATLYDLDGGREVPITLDERRTVILERQS